MKDIIEHFGGDNNWLSNFEITDIEYRGLIYPSVEHAYVSTKSKSKKWKKLCQDKNTPPGSIKKQSETVELIDGWDDMKFKIMKEILMIKFQKEPYKSLLIGTGKTYIQEGNVWGDKIWGVCLKTNKGKNRLGKIIMDIRTYLNGGGLF